mmetsp:Transcript_71131/g.169812  ORF Transcript_71131/g.169812 Transcript_71131/m.169812 type:complete len:408 (+) Transcript_71131:34-1257(+)
MALAMLRAVCFFLCILQLEAAREPLHIEVQHPAHTGVALYHLQHARKNWTIFLSLSILAFLIGVAVAKLAKRPTQPILQRGVAQDLLPNWKVTLTCGVMYMLLFSAQGMCLEIYKHFTPGKGNLLFCAPIAVLTSRFFALMAGWGYMLSAHGIPGLRRSFDFWFMVRYSGPSMIYCAFEISRTVCLGRMKASSFQLVLILAVVPLAVVRGICFKQFYSADKILALLILVLSGAGFLQTDIDMGVDPQAVFHVCLSMALYICGNICGEYVLKVDMDLPVALQCNWAWPSEILLALFISASTSFNSLEIENPFNGFNWLIWLMVSAMACHCIFSTYFTKICDGVAKVVAGICSLIFPTYMGLVFLGVESLEPHSRPLFAGIAVSAAVSFAFGRQASSGAKGLQGLTALS